MKLKHLTLAALTALTTSGTAFAQKAGDNVVSLGWFHLAPQGSSNPLQVTGSTFWSQTRQDNANRVLQTSGATFDDADTLGITFTHFFTDNIAAEAVLGIAPKFNLSGYGPLTLDGNPIASAKQWSPAILLKYYFGQAGDTWRPFMGLGASYLWYSNTTINQNLQQVITNAQPDIVATVKLSNSWAPVFNAGVNYNMDKNWSLAFSVSYIPVSTTMTLTTVQPDGNATVSKMKMRLNPVVTFLSLGYKF